MNTIEKPFVIINGVEGLVGTELALKFNENGYKVCGLYSEGDDVEDIIKHKELNKIVNIVSIGDSSIDKNCEKILRFINGTSYKNIIYIHALGVYPLELGSIKNINTKYNNRKEVEDMIETLGYKSFSCVIDVLSKTDKNVAGVFFSVIKDKYYDIKYDKWWSIVNEIKKYMSDMVNNHKNLNFNIYNISGVNTEKKLLLNEAIPKTGEINEFFMYKQKDFINTLFYEIEDIFSSKSNIQEKDIYDRTEENIYYY